VVYGSSTGTAKSMAESLSAAIGAATGSECAVTSMKDLDPEEVLASEAALGNALMLLVVSTWSEGTPPEDAKWFCQWLEEAAKDFR
jgi:tRNA wybutosine-synthesizing protein 1